MAIPLNPLSDNGLSALANNRTGYLNLPVSSLDVGAPATGTALGMIKQQQNAFDLAKQSQAEQAAMAQVKQQGTQQQANTTLLGQQAMQQQQGAQAYSLPFDQAKMNIAQQEATQQGQFQQGQLGIQQQQANTQGQQVADTQQFQQGQLANDAQTQKLERDKFNEAKILQDINIKSALNKQQLNIRGAAAGQMAMAANLYANNPEQFKAYMQTTVAKQIANGTLDPEHGAQLLKMNPQQVHDAAAIDLYGSALTSELGSANGKGGAASMMPSTNIYGKVTPNQTSENTIQNTAMGAQKSLTDNAIVLNSFDPKMFTGQGQLQAGIGHLAAKVGMEGTTKYTQEGSDLDAKITGFNTNVLQSIMDTLQQQKGVRFNKASVDVLAPEMPNAHDTAPTAWAKIVVLQQRMERAYDIAADMMKEGIDVNSKDFLDKVQAQMPSMSETPGTIPLMMKDGSTKQLGFNEVQGIADHNKISFQDAYQGIQAQNKQIAAASKH